MLGFSYCLWQIQQKMNCIFLDMLHWNMHWKTEIHMAKHLKCVTTGIKMYCGLPKAQFNFYAHVNPTHFFARLIQLHGLKLLSFISISTLFATSHNHVQYWHVQVKLKTNFLNLKCTLITFDYIHLVIHLAYMFKSDFPFQQEER